MNDLSSKTCVGDVLDQYLKALDTGSAPDREGLLARHPDLAEGLAAAFLGLDFVRGAAPSLAGGGEDAGIGKALGDYRLLREIGRGGMAVVYEAEQISLGRNVALKVLPFAAVLDPKQLQRFKNEALAAAHLRHPNIVPVYAVGCERGVHYYAMQYVEGQSLALAIRDMKGGGTGGGPRTPISSHGSNREPGYVRMAAALGMQAAEALDHAHQLGIVHRDVKPGNLLVDGVGTLWVTDFGLARSLNDAGLTMTGELLGTVRYMSPEQALAKRVPMDHRTDIYSLGATLYELFTLEPAFPGDDPHQVIQDIAFKDPLQPRKLNPALPVDLETVLLKAMTKDPAGRYSTAKEMADDLRRYLEDKPVLARRPSIAARAAKWSRRHRTVVAAVALILFVGIAALVAGAKREERKTRAALRSAEANLEFAHQAVDEFLVQIGIRGMKEECLPNAARQALLGKALLFYDRYLGDRHEASAHENRGAILYHLRRFDDALAAFDLAIAADPRHARALEGRGYALWRLNRWDMALAAFDDAITMHEESAGAHEGRGAVLGSLGRPEDEIAAYHRAIEIDPDSASAHYNLGVCLTSLGRAKEALEAYDHAIRLDPTDARAHENRALVLHDLGLHDEALAACDRAIGIEPNDARARVNRAGILISLGRPDEALLACRQALEIDSGLATAHAVRGFVLHYLGRRKEAVTAYERAIELDPDDAKTQCNRGNALRDLGCREEALAAYDRAVEVDPSNASAHGSRGALLLELGRRREALAAFDRAIEIDPADADAHCNRGAVLLELRDVEGAIREFREAIRIRDDYAEAHCNLGHAFLDQGRCKDALSCLRKGHELSTKRPDWPHPSQAWVESAEAKAEAEGRLDRVLAGATQPRDAFERIEFAELLYAKSRYPDAARMYSGAFAEDPGLAEDLDGGHRYRAACSAALAAAPGEEGSVAWRHRALSWLRADLAARERIPSGLAATLDRWKRDSDLAGVRDRLDELPAAEREGWSRLWADVARLLARAPPEK